MPQSKAEGQFIAYKNCYFKENRAYTEDNVPVYSICIYKIPRKHNEEELHNYFAQFGVLEKFYFVCDNKIPHCKDHNSGFAIYKDAIDAAKALQQPYHALEKRQQILIKAGDSWSQPRQARLKCKHGADLNINSTADDIRDDDTNAILENAVNYSGLLNLNDDCLESICKQLDLHSQIYFSHACQRFRHIFEMCCKSQYRIFELKRLEGFTLWEMRHFFETAGPYLEKILTTEKYRSRPTTLQLISEFCPNIKVLEIISNIERHYKYLQKLCHSSKSINTLIFYDCSLRDCHCATFRKLPRLEHLQINENYGATGEHLHKLTNLKTLSLDRCSHIDENVLIKIIQSLKKLKTLNIAIYYNDFSTRLYNEMVEHCQNLEDLTIACYSSQYQCLAHLPKLRRLELTMRIYPPIIQQQLIIELAEQKADQLEYLKLVGENYLTTETVKYLALLKKLKYLSCPNNELLNDVCLYKFGGLKELEELVIRRCPAITNDGLMQLLFKCTKLKCVDVKRCKGITNEFVFEAIELLRERAQQVQEQQPTKQLMCWVGKTSISKDILNNAQYISAKALIKLSFDTELSGDMYDYEDADENENENEINDDYQNDVHENYVEVNEDNNDNNEAEQYNYNYEPVKLNLDEVDCFDFYELFQNSNI